MIRTLAEGTPLRRMVTRDLGARPARADGRIEVIEVHDVMIDLAGALTVVAHDSTTAKRSAITLEFPKGSVAW